MPTLCVVTQPLTLCVNTPGTRSVRIGVTTRSVGTIKNIKAKCLIVPTLCVDMQPLTLCVNAPEDAERRDRRTSWSVGAIS